jgi:hypothetical protein
MFRIVTLTIFIIISVFIPLTGCNALTDASSTLSVSPKKVTLLKYFG